MASLINFSSVARRAHLLIPRAAAGIRPASTITAAPGQARDSRPRDSSTVFVKSGEKVGAVMIRTKMALGIHPSVSVRGVGSALPLAIRCCLILEKEGYGAVGDVKLEFVSRTADGKTTNTEAASLVLNRSANFKDLVMQYEQARLARLEERLTKAAEKIESGEAESEKTKSSEIGSEEAKA